MRDALTAVGILAAGCAYLLGWIWLVAQLGADHQIPALLVFAVVSGAILYRLWR